MPLQEIYSANPSGNILVYFLLKSTVLSVCSVVYMGNRGCLLCLGCWGCVVLEEYGVGSIINTQFSRNETSSIIGYCGMGGALYNWMIETLMTCKYYIELYKNSRQKESIDSLIVSPISGDLGGAIQVSEYKVTSLRFWRWLGYMGVEGGGSLNDLSDKDSNDMHNYHIKLKQ